jgi:hypothetical protein
VSIFASHTTGADYFGLAVPTPSGGWADSEFDFSVYSLTGTIGQPGLISGQLALYNSGIDTFQGSFAVEYRNSQYSDSGGGASTRVVIFGSRTSAGCSYSIEATASSVSNIYRGSVPKGSFATTDAVDLESDLFLNSGARFDFQLSRWRYASGGLFDSWLFANGPIQNQGSVSTDQFGNDICGGQPYNTGFVDTNPRLEDYGTFTYAKGAKMYFVNQLPITSSSYKQLLSNLPFTNGSLLNYAVFSGSPLTYAVPVTQSVPSGLNIPRNSSFAAGGLAGLLARDFAQPRSFSLSNLRATCVGATFVSRDVAQQYPASLLGGLRNSTLANVIHGFEAIAGDLSVDDFLQDKPDLYSEFSPYIPLDDSQGSNDALYCKFATETGMLRTLDISFSSDGNVLLGGDSANTPDLFQASCSSITVSIA